MKTFEENLNDWVEGRLTEKESADFEASLPQISAEELEQQEQASQLRALLKEHVTERNRWEKYSSHIPEFLFTTLLIYHNNK